MKHLITAAITERSDEIVEFSRQLAAVPEAGFGEHRSTALVADRFHKCNFHPTAPLALSGVRGMITGGAPQPTVAVIGELDAVSCPGHEAAHPHTGLAHVCGHNVTVAAMWGAGIGLSVQPVRSALSGSVALIAAPAEEFIGLPQRARLVEQGVISYYCGKQELIRRSLLSDVSACVMVHVHAGHEGPAAVLSGTQGLCAQLITIRKRTHKLELLSRVDDITHELEHDQGLQRVGARFRAAADPLCSDGLSLVVYVTAPDIHGLTTGYQALLPRLTSLSDLIACTKFIPGLLPLSSCQQLNDLCADNCRHHLNVDTVRSVRMDGYSDVGDVSMFMPVAVILMSAATGELHTPTFAVSNHRMACVDSAVILAHSVYDLLSAGASRLARITSSFRPQLANPDAEDALWQVIAGNRHMPR